MKLTALSIHPWQAAGCSTMPLLLTLAVGPASVSAAPEADATYKARAEAKARALLNDLSSRRRVAKLFRNHHSMFHGPCSTAYRRGS